ncbi:MAG TPA: HPP family protein, partial [Candidatus Limnocylindrales bacterium]|nr:HPP family protein [Candidatus Limnocylindrales bacterium]
MPDALWGPVVAAVLILVVGALGVVAGSPWLVPSLGPTAVLIAVTPLHPTARPWNTVVGHLGGVLAGALAVTAFGAWAAPTVMGDHVLVAARVLAATLAIALTLVIGSMT